jgi:hypothetical protein
MIFYWNGTISVEVTSGAVDGVYSNRGWRGVPARRKLKDEGSITIKS